MKKKTLIGNIISYIFLSIILIITIFPILYTISASFKTNSEIFAHPELLFSKNPTVENYKIAWNSQDFQVGRLVWNSIFYTMFNVFVSLMISSMAGYVFARGHFKFKKIIFGCFLSLMFIQLGGVSIYATFQVLNAIHVPRSLYSLMLIDLFGVPVSSIYLVRGYVDTLPREIDEAACIDGASFPMIYSKIILPLLKPILATIGILSFKSSWNDYLMPTIFTVTTPEQRTLIVGLMALKSSGGAASAWNLMLAGSVIALIPVLFAYAVANKYIISGLSAGAVKG